MIVVEASAMVDALVDDPANPGLLALLADEELHAPALLDFEVASALRGHVLDGKLDPARLDEAVEDYTAFWVERHQMTDLLGHVLDLRDNFTVYDAASSSWPWRSRPLSSARTPSCGSDSAGDRGAGRRLTRFSGARACRHGRCGGAVVTADLDRVGACGPNRRPPCQAGAWGPNDCDHRGAGLGRPARWRRW